MENQVNRCAPLMLETVEMSELTQINGGIWDYSNRMGFLGQMLENIQDRRYGSPLSPKTLDQAAHQALEGWVSIP